MRVERELMRGAGPTAVLKLLTGGPMYGYELVQALALRSAGVLDMGQSTLYPLLYNLEAKGLVEGYHEAAADGRDRRYYKLTESGRRKLADDTRQWQALAGAMIELGVLARPAKGGVA